MNWMSRSILLIFILTLLFSKAPLILGEENTLKYETLIDFTKYESRNQDDGVYSPAEGAEAFREKYYKSPRSQLKREEQIYLSQSFIPWFRVTPQDMALDRWVIEFTFPKAHNSPPAKLTQKNAIPPFYKELYKDSADQANRQGKMLGARIYFPSITDEMSAYIYPPYEIYPYDQNGKFCNINNGVLKNTGYIKKIAMTVGIKFGNIENISLALVLKDHLGGRREYPMGFLYSANQGDIRYYKDYDGTTFNDDQIIYKKTLKARSLYYKVYYINKKPVLWVMVKDQREIYHEVLFEWTNSDYLPPYKRPVHRQQDYPNEFPYIIFDSLVIRKQDENSARKFHLFVKDIKVQYNLAKPNENYDIDDDENWKILSEWRKTKRKELEAVNSSRMYQMFKKGQAKGFTNYQDFKTKYFHRFPPQKKRSEFQ